MARQTLVQLLNGVTQFGYWTALKEGVGIPRPGNGIIRTAICRCICGVEREVVINNLKRGISKNCGCKTGEMIAALETTHGMSYTPEYKAWAKMKERCHNPKCKDYADYGGRGISVCERWASSFEAFYADMGPRPSSQHSIDRIKVDGNYEPGNVRWADKVVQAGNKRTTRYVELDGKRMALRAACRAIGADYKLVHARMKKGATFEQATR